LVGKNRLFAFWMKLKFRILSKEIASPREAGLAMTDLEDNVMSDGGFVVKFEGAKVKPQTCYAVKFDYDEWSYTINNNTTQKMPSGTKRIIIETE